MQGSGITTFSRRYHGGFTALDPARRMRHTSAPLAGSLTIQLLGPARIDGFGALRRRDAVVLEVLCIEPGEPVSVEVIADALWGDEVPPSSSKVVQGAVMRLRKLLGAAAIETTPAG